MGNHAEVMRKCPATCANARAEASSGFRRETRRAPLVWERDRGARLMSDKAMRFRSSLLLAGWHVKFNNCTACCCFPVLTFFISNGSRAPHQAMRHVSILRDSVSFALFL